MDEVGIALWGDLRVDLLLGPGNAVRLHGIRDTRCGAVPAQRLGMSYKLA